MKTMGLKRGYRTSFCLSHGWQCRSIYCRDSVVISTVHTGNSIRTMTDPELVSVTRHTRTYCPVISWQCVRVVLADLRELYKAHSSQYVPYQLA